MYLPCCESQQIEEKYFILNRWNNYYLTYKQYVEEITGSFNDLWIPEFGIRILIRNMGIFAQDLFPF